MWFCRRRMSCALPVCEGAVLVRAARLCAPRSVMITPFSSTLAAATAAAAAAGALVTYKLLRRPSKASARVLVAVSGTIQDGFELRKNINYVAPGEATVEAVLVGYGVCRGAKMFFDVKDKQCREYDPAVPHRVNPAMVLTGNASDANQYALYLVDERACLKYAQPQAAPGCAPCLTGLCLFAAPCSASRACSPCARTRCASTSTTRRCATGRAGRRLRRVLDVDRALDSSLMPAHPMARRRARTWPR